MTNNNLSLYQERANRIYKAMNCEPVDRVPCIYMATAFSPKYMGMSLKQFCLDPDAAVDVTIEAMKRVGNVDGINLIAGGILPVDISLAWLSKCLIPGIDLDENVLWQVLENETMSVDDYDLLIDKGVDALYEKIVPQVCDMKLLERHVAWMKESLPGAVKKYHDAGYITLSSGGTSIPFEALCGARSMTQFYYDLYRIPDKVQAAMDIMVPFQIDLAISNCKATGVSSIWVGGWRTASAMLAPKLWDRFVWPYFRKVADGLIENGINPVFHFDQDWTRDLGRLLELPAKKCILNLDGMTDIRKAAKILKGHMAIMGDIPSSILAAGSPEDVRNYLSDLIQDIGHEGLLFAPGCDAPLNAKPENMEAYVAACHEFGTVKSA